MEQSNMNIVEGGCLCGQVRYKVNRDGARTVVCHCRHCQKQSGSAFSIMLIAGRAGFEIEGELGTYVDHGDNGRAVLRRFCPVCGSVLISEPESLPAAVVVKAGTLDDVSTLTPQLHLWCSSAQPWVALPGDVPCLASQA
jgi:hypothetical protein